MSETKRTGAEEALRRGLEELGTATVSGGFDETVLAGVRRGSGLWWRLRPSLAPALAGALCSVSVLLALAWLGFPEPPAKQMGAPGTADPIARLERLIENPNTAGLALFGLRMLADDPTSPADERRSDVPFGATYIRLG